MFSLLTMNGDPFLFLGPGFLLQPLDLFSCMLVCVQLNMQEALITDCIELPNNNHITHVFTSSSVFYSVTSYISIFNPISSYCTDWSSLYI